MSDGPDLTSVARRALDLLVFAPAGFLLTAVDEVPHMVEEGRSRVGGQIRNARAVGEMMVAYGRRDLSRRMGRPAPRGGSAGTDSAEADRAAAGAAGHVGVARPVEVAGKGGGAGPVEVAGKGGGAGRPGRGAAESPDGPAVRRFRGADGRGAPVHLAIPEYDTLSASQVVRRLDGLGRDELDAVRRHEAAGRGRRTILSRAEQLLGTSGAAPRGPGPSA